MVRIIVFCYWQMEKKFKVEAYVRLRVKIHQFNGRLLCVITYLGNGPYLIHDDDWLNMYRARMDYESKTCVTKKSKCEAKPTTLKRPSPGDGFENHMYCMYIENALFTSRGIHVILNHFVY